MLDFILEHKATSSDQNGISTDISVLWEVVMEGISGVWPATRTKLNGVSLGDVWPSVAFSKIYENEFPKHHKDELNVKEGSLVVFHKLSQWLTYSLMEPLSLYGITFRGTEKMTGLAEYRNGGLFVDAGVLSLKESVKAKFPAGAIPRFEVFDQAVVEWRALTVALLDLVGERVRSQLQMSEKELPLVKILEAGTWKAGREIAKEKRPETRGPPIEIISDGTVF